ncbi:MAG: type II toxin-antitoxin system PemK/MazF family toxin [Deltaproteobacteria bacterium]|nr:type II toxin-antitoxin system PemK/MazF family toxin [Deltaproteobacteria bacterium]
MRLCELDRPDKRRPVLVLTRNSALAYLTRVTVAPVTTTIRGVPSEIALGAESGLKTPSAANLHNLVTVERSRLGRWLGALAAARRDELRAALLFVFDLDH